MPGRRNASRGRAVWWRRRRLSGTCKCEGNLNGNERPKDSHPNQYHLKQTQFWQKAIPCSSEHDAERKGTTTGGQLQRTEIINHYESQQRCWGWPLYAIKTVNVCCKPPKPHMHGCFTFMGKQEVLGSKRERSNLKSRSCRPDGGVTANG